MRLQYASIWPPDENDTVRQDAAAALDSTVRVSAVSPETLLHTTKVSASAVLGRLYPLTMLTCMSRPDMSASARSPRAPDPPMPAKTTWFMPSTSRAPGPFLYAPAAISGHAS